MDRELLEAACQGSRERVNELVRQGADVNSGMCGAAEGGRKDLVEFFIKKGAKNWDWGMIGAAVGCHKKFVDFFIEHGAYDWNAGLFWSKIISLKIFFIDQGADDIDEFPLFYKDICRLYHLPNGILISKLLRRYIARFKGSKVRNEKVIINDKHESTLDQVFISPPDTIVKFRDVDYQVKGYIFYLAQSRNPHFKQSRNPQFKRYVHETDFDECHIIKKLKIY